MPSFAPLIASVKPAVVSVKVKIAQSNASWNDSSGQWSNLPPEIQRFLKQFGNQNGAVPQTPPPVMMGEGSGFFISSDGYVVTNNHVVQNAKSVTVTTDDGKVLDAKVIGTDPKTDVALLKVDQPGDFPYVAFAKQEPRVGDWVVAIGNPYGLGGTVTAGIVSADGRDIGEGPYDRFMQIDAPINKGNSGGPTFNMQGQVIGMNTAIFSPSGGSVGIGFDIPANTVDQVVTALEHGGVVKRGYLGVEIQAVGPDIAESLGLKKAEGAIVDKTMPGTPAADAGLKSGDVITKLNGQPVQDAGDLTRGVGSMKPGDKIELTYLRDGAEKTADMTLAPQTTETTAKADTGKSEGRRHRQCRSERRGRGQRTEGRRRHPRCRRQARVDAGGGEVRNRQRKAGRQEGRSDADPDRGRRPLRGHPVPQGLKLGPGAGISAPASIRPAPRRRGSQLVQRRQ
jgi:serine protease Do